MKVLFYYVNIYAKMYILFSYSFNYLSEKNKKSFHEFIESEYYRNLITLLVNVV